MLRSMVCFMLEYDARAQYRYLHVMKVVHLETHSEHQTKNVGKPHDVSCKVLVRGVHAPVTHT